MVAVAALATVSAVRVSAVGVPTVITVRISAIVVWVTAIIARITEAEVNAGPINRRRSVRHGWRVAGRDRRRINWRDGSGINRRGCVCRPRMEADTGQRGQRR